MNNQRLPWQRAEVQVLLRSHRQLRQELPYRHLWRVQFEALPSKTERYALFIVHLIGHVILVKKKQQ